MTHEYRRDSRQKRTVSVPSVTHKYSGLWF
jgi:hypothetical protein